MRKNPLPYIAAGLAVFISSCATAGPRRSISSGDSEPWRIYDLGSRNFINNPDYRKSAPVKWTTKRARQSTEPRRVYNPMTQQFEDSAEIREPKSEHR
jgi:hypothetical protein